MADFTFFDDEGHVPKRARTIDHASLYSVEEAVKRHPLLAEFVAVVEACGFSAQVRPVIDWHTQHCTASVSSFGNVFLCPEPADDTATVYPLALHGPAPHENWLQWDTFDYFAIKHQGEFVFVERLKVTAAVVDIGAKNARSPLVKFTLGMDPPSDEQ